MFTYVEMLQIRAGLAMAQKSAQRLSNRADQPASVAQEYRAVISAVSALLVKVDAEIVKLTPKK